MTYELSADICDALLRTIKETHRDTCAELREQIASIDFSDICIDGSLDLSEEIESLRILIIDQE